MKMKKKLFHKFLAGNFDSLLFFINVFNLKKKRFDEHVSKNKV